MNLSQKWIDKLIELPETGMGYQIIDVYLKNGVIVPKVVVMGCEEIFQPISFSEDDIQDIKLHPIITTTMR